MTDTSTPSGIIVDIDGKVSPAVLSGILGINVSLCYSEAQKGRLPPVLIESTYRECIQTYINHFKKAVDLKLQREANDFEIKKQKLELQSQAKKEKIEAGDGASKRYQSRYAMEDGDMHPLIESKLKQEIRLNIAKESAIWMKLATERKEYISFTELYSLAEVFIIAIRGVLIDISEDIPEAKERIAEAMEELYNLGEAITQIADLDEVNFSQYMLDKELDLDAIKLELTTGHNIA